MIYIEERSNILTLGAYTDGTAARIRWVDDDESNTPQWDLYRTTTGRLQLTNHQTDTQTLWVDPDDTLHVQNIAIESDSSIDAGTLDGLDSAQFLRRDVAASTANDLDVGGTLTEQGAAVLTEADEGSLNAGTLDGHGLASVRPAIADDGSAIVESPATIDAGQALTATDNGDGSVTIDNVGGNAVGTTPTASGDGSQTTFTLPHDLGAVPMSVDVTATAADAAGDYWVRDTTDADVTIEYASAPPSGTDNLSWHVTAVGDTGSGVYTITIEDNGGEVDRASTLDFGSGLDAAQTASGEVTVDAAVDTAVSASDDGTQVLGEASGFDFGEALTVRENGDGTVTVDSEGGTAVSDDATEVVGAADDINFGNALSVTDDGDDTVTVHASNDASTLGGYSAGQFLRSDADDTHEGVLSLSTLDAAGTSVSVVDDLATDAGVGLVNDTGSATHRVRARRDGVSNLGGGGAVPTDYGVTLESDATIAFVETDNDRVAGWVDTNTESLTMPGGVRVGDSGGAPDGVALDVRGEARFAVETRTSDPSNPEVGRLWLRTDLLPDT